MAEYDWLPIESAPKDGAYVLLFIPNYRVKVWIGSFDICESYRNGERTSRSERWNLQSVTFFGRDPEPTHWMPLPGEPAPK